MRNISTRKLSLRNIFIKLFTHLSWRQWVNTVWPRYNTVHVHDAHNSFHIGRMRGGDMGCVFWVHNMVCRWAIAPCFISFECGKACCVYQCFFLFLNRSDLAMMRSRFRRSVITYHNIMIPNLNYLMYICPVRSVFLVYTAAVLLPSVPLLISVHVR